MKTLILAVACAAFAGAAMAQDGARIRSDASADANANAAVFGQSTSLAASQGGNVTQVYNNSGTQTTNYTGSYDVRSVPSTAAPGIITAHNCALGVSAGGSWLGGGISLGGSYVDQNCERISQAAALNTLAGRNAAIIHMAAIPSVCSSLRQAGVVASCPNDKPAETASTKNYNTAAAPSVAYSKCAYEGGAIRVGVKRGSDRSVAISQCRRALGR